MRNVLRVFAICLFFAFIVTIVAISYPKTTCIPIACGNPEVVQKLVSGNTMKLPVGYHDGADSLVRRGMGESAQKFGLTDRRAAFYALNPKVDYHRPLQAGQVVTVPGPR